MTLRVAWEPSNDGFDMVNINVQIGMIRGTKC